MANKHFVLMQLDKHKKIKVTYSVTLLSKF